ncbi:indolepyruvate ferredoxin oxidoreductase family protein [Prosthecomicrobium hirschii]|uniref:indolepyruvate ferredoxin oxidoreductase family protein n=1 Tax=Prosthecodimorpha hirschii TaxID=665126 RepID=UPI002220D97F|nr:indolepyruvate ferredoxin oxidoreductase family protein [Prosthecomicrobium hirschii]MCW1839670.1 indolepyruvate ferredoxin oxidoreductase family protein [Prosthecomicrobium hirschii]
MTEAVRAITLDDKYALESGRAYMTGIQALVRLPLDRIRLDRRAGLDTAGFISGYRGSPLGGYDQQLTGARRPLGAHNVVFTPGVNEELAATAVWGTQKVGLAGQGSKHDGVFGIWYGKAPGVDRCGDVFRHANASGTDRHGGCLAIAGDDHLAKSSTVACQSEFHFADLEIPVLNPADLQDVLDFGLHGLELSRYSGLWVSLIALADTMDSSGIVDVDPARLKFLRPRDLMDPRDGGDFNKPILLKTRLENEASVREIRLPAAKAYVRANGLDGIRFGSPRPRIGLVATGKAYRDLRQALDLLGIDDARATRMGLAIYKVAMSWPIEPIGIANFAKSLETLVVVEHKRPLMEAQIKDLLYNWPDHRRPQIWGKTTPKGEPFLSSIRDLSAAEMVPALMSVLPGAAEDAEMSAVADRMVQQSMWAQGHATDAKRSPYFCSGCPHSSSTKVPDGARAMPGIGCHAMTEVAERTTEGLVAMGGEGVPWVGAHHFAKDGHMFANLGDGTFYHSGSLAIRQAVAAKVPITYKILFNDAVAMTGGQPHDGPLSVPKIVALVAAEGVERIVVVSDHPEQLVARPDLRGVPVHHRDELLTVERELQGYRGVSVLIYDQTCAAEKRRRRKKGSFADPARRLFVNDRVCEDCGDCSVQSNCVSVEPVATDFGRKRKINQSSCNKDYSCVAGFCPSFVWVEGGAVRRAPKTGPDPATLAAALPVPVRAGLERTLNLLVTGIGGMGVTTVGAVLAVAAHLDGLNTLTLDMTGLAQKGGPVTSFVRFAPGGTAIEGPRVPTAALDVLIASDMLVAAGAETLTVMSQARTATVANARVAPTAEFVLRQVQSFEAARLSRTLAEASRDYAEFNAAGLAEKLFGDAIYANMMLVGAALQKGLLPVSLAAVENAIRLNGASVGQNLQALHAGRLIAVDPAAVLALVEPDAVLPERSLDERIAFLADELTRYQDAAYAARYRDLVAAVRAAEARAMGPGVERLAWAATENLYKVMAIKDEYEVARLYADPAFKAKLAEQFEGVDKIRVMLAPPLIARHDPATGRPRKIAFGPWIFGAFRLLAGLKRLRGGMFDVFARTGERRAERALREDYAADLQRLARDLTPANHGLAVEIARVPETVKGYGPVKEANMARAAKRREGLVERFAAGPAMRPVLVAAE